MIRTFPQFPLFSFPRQQASRTLFVLLIPTFLKAFFLPSSRSFTFLPMPAYISLPSLHWLFNFTDRHGFSGGPHFPDFLTVSSSVFLIFQKPCQFIANFFPVLSPCIQENTRTPSGKYRTIPLITSGRKVYLYFQAKNIIRRYNYNIKSFSKLNRMEPMPAGKNPAFPDNICFSLGQIILQLFLHFEL